MRLARSGSALSSVLARLRNSNDVSVSLASSSSLDSRCSGVVRFLFRKGVLKRFDGRRSGSLETDRLADSRGLLVFSGGEVCDEDLTGVCDEDLEGGAGRVWTTLRICGF